MDKEVAKTPSEDATTLAGRMINHDPFTDEALNQLNIRLCGHPLLPDGQARLRAALQETFGPYVKDAQSVAGALLRLDPQAGQGGE